MSMVELFLIPPIIAVVFFMACLVIAVIGIMRERDKQHKEIQDIFDEALKEVRKRRKNK